MSESIKKTDPVDDVKSSTSNSSGATKSTGKFDAEKLASTVKTLQFAWFVGNLLTLVGVSFFLLTYLRIFPSTYRFWYNIAVVGVILSFGILEYQTVKKNGFNLKSFLKDDNTDYLYLGIVFLLLRPYIIFPIIPFQLFSLFHVLTYTKSDLLTVFGIGEDSAISKQIGQFVSTFNSQSIVIATLFEIYSIHFLALRVILFRKRSLTPFLVYLIFIKLRYEKSPLVRRYFKVIEVRVDNATNSLGQPLVKEYWIKFKQGLKKVNSYILVNDYTQEKEGH